MIVVNDAFVYIHHPKTGGTFVTEMLRKVSSIDKAIYIKELPGLKHAGIGKIPDEFRHLKVVTNVRNVFEHYVSRYTFGWWADPEHSNKIFKMEKVRDEYPEFPDLSFSQFLRFFNQWHLRGSMAAGRIEQLSKANIGFNSWVLTRLTSKKPAKLIQNIDDMKDDNLHKRFSKIRFLRTENLNSDLHGLLKECGADDKKILPILDAPPILPKKGGRGKKKKTWHKYFNEQDIAFIVEKDRLYFRLFPDMNPG